MSLRVSMWVGDVKDAWTWQSDTCERRYTRVSRPKSSAATGTRRKSLAEPNEVVAALGLPLPLPPPLELVDPPLPVWLGELEAPLDVGVTEGSL